jgi:hypothetical protein
MPAGRFKETKRRQRWQTKRHVASPWTARLGARAVALKDTLPGALGCRQGAPEHRQKNFADAVDLPPRGSSWLYRGRERGRVRGALLAPFILVP